MARIHHSPYWSAFDMAGLSKPIVTPWLASDTGILGNVTAATTPAHGGLPVAESSLADALATTGGHGSSDTASTGSSADEAAAPGQRADPAAAFTAPQTADVLPMPAVAGDDLAAAGAPLEYKLQWVDAPAAGLFTSLLADTGVDTPTDVTLEAAGDGSAPQGMLGCCCPICGDGGAAGATGIGAPVPDGDLDFSVPVGAGWAGGDILPNNGSGDPWEWTLGNPPVYTGDARIDGVLWGSNWSDGSISYSDPDSTGDYQAGYFTTAGYPNFSVGFGQISAAQLLATHNALNQSLYTQLPAALNLSVEAFTNLSITYNGSGSGTGTIRLADTSSGVVSTARVADFPGGTLSGSAIHGGDVWFGGSGQNPTLGNYDYITIVHELGHALGLKHGHQASNAFGAGAPVLPAATDSMEYSVMTYRSYVGGGTSGYTNETWGYAQTWMMYDIRALQEIYGADFTANSGNTVYSWSPTSGNTLINGSIALQPGANKIFATLWDGDGIDTYDLSAYATGVNIDLTPGGYSVFSFAQRADLNQFAAGFEASGNIYNALQFNGDARSLIENAIGGSGNDTLLGNVANNSLVGGAGNDTIDGGSGNDTIDGGTGADSLVGGFGDDLYIVDNVGDIAGEVAGGVDTVQASVTYTLSVNLENLTLTGSGAIDGTGNDSRANVITGNSGNNVLSGLALNDTIIGGGGVDTLYGGTGDDVLQGGFTTDTVYGEDGNDSIVVLNGEFYDNVDGGAGTDTLDHSASTYTGTTFDFEAGTITGSGINGLSAFLLNIEVYLDGAGDNTIVSDGSSHSYYGNGGDDYMIAEIGGETMDGGAGGTDTIDLARFNGTYVVDMTTGLTNFANELYTNFENLISGNGIDTITGTSGNNVITTNAGNDSINAGAGNDTVFAGDGDDVITDTQSMFSTGQEDDVYDGGAGTDTLVHDLSWVNTVTFDLTAGFTTFNGNRDQLISIENLVVGGSASVIGSAVDNVLTVNGAGANVIEGRAGNDTINAGGGNDSINAGSGNDSVLAGDGDDIITDTEGMSAPDDDVYDGGAGTDTLVHDLNWVPDVTFDLTAGFAQYFGNRDQLISIENLTVGGAATVIGSAVANVLIVNGTGANVINGMAGNDTIDAGGGNDTINAGPGNDSVLAGDGDDIITDTETMLVSEDDIYNGGAGIDTLVHDFNWVSTVTFDLTAGFSMFGGNRDQLISIENLTVGGSATVIGSAVDNVLIVNGSGANNIDGRAGNDSILAGGGNDTVAGGDGNDTIQGGAGTDDIDGGNGNDLIQILDGEFIDNVVGGANTDTLDMSAVTTAITFNALLGTYQGSVVGDSARTHSGIEIFLGGSGNDTITSGGDGEFHGNDGDDLMIAGLTAVSEVMDGGAGNDTLDTTSFNGTYVVNMVTGLTNYASELFTNFENLITGNGADTVTGTSVANVISTNGGNDSVDAGDGDDVVDGGSGNDTLNGGNGNDTLLGQAGQDFINGGAGADRMEGGDDNDIYIVDDVGDVVVEVDTAGGGTFDLVQSFITYTLGTGLEALALIGGVLNIDGTGNAKDNAIQGNEGDNVLSGLDGNDSLSGFAGNDTLLGGEGNDVLDGNAGADSMAGGNGDDGYYVDDIGDIVFENYNETGLDTAYSTLAFYQIPSYVENLTLLGGAANLNGKGNWMANVLTGNDGNNLLEGANSVDTLYGGLGNDTLDGGAGADSMVGGLGDDTYVVTTVTDIIVEGVGEGIDTVRSLVTAGYYTLPANVENLVTFLTSGNLGGIGNALDNTMTGSGANDDFAGLDGNDSLLGALGNDTLNGGNGNDTLGGGGGNDSLIGGAGDDSMNGGGGNDSLTGGAGNDTMNGGDGDDVYQNVAAGDVINEGFGQGYDRVLANGNTTLGANFEYLELLTGTTGTGNNLDNTLVGNANNNTLSGLDGADTLAGKTGNDALFAGVDAFQDRFVFDTALNATTNVDTLFETDFPEDQLLLDNSIFTALLSTGGTGTGTLGAGFYFEGAGLTGGGAADAIGIWYDLSNGRLYYNPTAGVGGDSTLFAIVDGASAALDSVDFTLFTAPFVAAGEFPSWDDPALDVASLPPTDIAPQYADGVHGLV